MSYPIDGLYETDETEKKFNINELTGKDGLYRVMNYEENLDLEVSLKIKYNFDYKPDIKSKYGEIFSMDCGKRSEISLNLPLLLLPIKILLILFIYLVIIFFSII